MRAKGKGGKTSVYRGHKSAGDSTPTLEAKCARAKSIASRTRWSSI